MAQTKESLQRNSFMMGMPPAQPFIAILAEMNGTFLESVATAQKDWIDFVYRRVKEDVAASRQLMSCHSLPDLHQVYSEYLRTALDHYQQQSQRVVQRGQAMAQHLAETAEEGIKETGRAHH